MAASRPTLVIACGALAREILALVETYGWRDLAITCLPADYHNTPDKIPEGVRRKIRENRGRYERIFVAYGDCGTGGLLDQVLAEEGAERIAGPHCYQFFMGTAEFTALAEAEPGCLFLTDYLARHFDRIIIKGLGLDRHPELRDDYFGNYTSLVYLAQTDDAELRARAEAAARRLGLAYQYRFAGYGELEGFLAAAVEEPSPEAKRKGARA
jgi:Protein of unknown function (DUF1638)